MIDLSKVETGSGGTYWYKEADGFYTEWHQCMNYEVGGEPLTCEKLVKVRTEEVAARYRIYCLPCGIADQLSRHEEMRADMIDDLMKHEDPDFARTYDEALLVVRQFFCNCTDKIIGDLCTKGVPMD